MGVLSVSLRVMLLVGSAVVFSTVSWCIRKRKIQLKDSIFWILFSLFLVLISAFPILAVWTSKIFGIQSPSNCVFLIVIFLLGCHQFLLSIRTSQLEMKIVQKLQQDAIQNTITAEEKRDETENLLLFR